MVPEGGPYIRHAGSLFPFLKTMCDQIYMMEELNPAGQLASQLFCASMVVIASQLDTFPQAMAAETREEEFISRILDYLNEHFTEELNLDKIAEDMHCSATYVSHGLKKSHGYDSHQLYYPQADRPCSDNADLYRSHGDPDCHYGGIR